MKRIVALLLACALLLTGCASPSKETASQTRELPALAEENVPETREETVRITSPPEETTAEDSSFSVLNEESNIEETPPNISVNYTGLNDPALLEDTENAVYAALTRQLNHTAYRIENVSVAYVSKEYLEELAYNSQSNMFFGYSLEELDAQFQGNRYVFTLGQDGATTVIPLAAYDNTYEQVFQNVAIGTGVILISVTLSVISGGVGSPAVSAIFATSAKSATVYAASSGILNAAIAGVINGVQTNDVHEALKVGILEGSKGFCWGAIAGFVLGGASEFVTLKAATKSGLTLNEAATILQQTNYPANIVKLFRTPEECEIYANANLSPEIINGKIALTRHIDLTYQSEVSGQAVTNLERMQLGYAPIDSATNLPYELHHIGQRIDSPLAILTKSEHISNGHNTILHDANIANGAGVHSLLESSEWAKQTREFWKAYGKILATA